MVTSSAVGGGGTNTNKKVPGNTNGGAPSPLLPPTTTPPSTGDMLPGSSVPDGTVTESSVPVSDSSNGLNTTPPISDSTSMGGLGQDGIKSPSTPDQNGESQYIPPIFPGTPSPTEEEDMPHSPFSDVNRQNIPSVPSSGIETYIYILCLIFVAANLP